MVDNTDRYRVEEGRLCIDIHLRSSQQLFDGRDPAPFRERDLDDHAVSYLAGAVQELPRHADVKLVFWISDDSTPPLSDAALVDAVRAHFRYEVADLDRRIRQHLRRGQIYLLVGLSVLVVFLSLAELAAAQPAGHARQILREGLVITGWVAMWRPLEALLYDWWPMVDERRIRRRLGEAPMEVRHGAASEREEPPAGAARA